MKRDHRRVRNRIFIQSLAVVFLLLPVLIPGTEKDAPARQWTLSDGSSLEASVVELMASQVVLRLPDGELKTLNPGDFGVVDRIYLEARIEAARKAISKDPAAWPVRTEVGRDLTIRQKGAQYVTGNFVFSPDRPVAAEFAAEVAQIFEGTLRAVEAMPLGLKPTPPEGMEHFQARFTDRARFEEEIGTKFRPPPGDVVKGIYLTPKKYILVPFDSIVLPRQRKALGSANVDPNTLIHEITHQLMHDWLPVTPYWLLEGVAEYVALIPYGSGTFEFDKAETGLRRILSSRYEIEGPIEMIHPGDIFGVRGRDGWNDTVEEYLAAMVMTYFFIHLDTEKTGGPLIAFFGEIRKARDETDRFIAEYNAAVASYEEKRLAYNREVEKYNEAVRKRNTALKERKGVSESGAAFDAKTEADGRVRISGRSSVLTPPAPIELPPILARNKDVGTLDIVEIAYSKAIPHLLRDRSYDQLARQMERAFEEAGLELRIQEPGQAGAEESEGADFPSTER